MHENTNVQVGIPKASPYAVSCLDLDGWEAIALWNLCISNGVSPKASKLKGRGKLSLNNTSGASTYLRFET